MDENKVIFIIPEQEDEFQGVEKELIELGYRIEYFKSSTQLIQALEHHQPTLIILDIILQDIDGVELLVKLKEIKSLSRTWLVFYSERDEDYSKVAGLEAGADDYITKPIHPRLLSAKLKSILKRRKISFQLNEPLLKTLGFTLDHHARTIRINKEEIQLLKKEFDLLRVFLEFPGKVFSRNEIKMLVWENKQTVLDRNIDVHISNLRNKIGKTYIQTIKGVGYKFKPSEQ